MARYDHIPIFQKTYILTVHIYEATGHFKREYKYTLGEKLKLLCNEFLDLIVIGNSEENKLKSIEKLDNKLETLRIHLRLAFDLKVISRGLLGEFNKQIEEIGKQIGGWQRWAADNRLLSIPARVLNF